MKTDKILNIWQNIPPGESHIKKSLPDSTVKGWSDNEFFLHEKVSRIVYHRVRQTVMRGIYVNP